MSDTCPTVKVKADNEQGFIVINESDLTKEHELFAAEKPSETGGKKAKATVEKPAE